MAGIVIGALVGASLGAGALYGYQTVRRSQAKSQIDKDLANAKTKASDIVLKAKDEALKIENERRREWQKTENRLADREKTLDNKLEELDRRSEKLRAHEDEIDDLKNEIRQIRTRQQEKLEKIAGLKKKDAAEKLMQMTERDIRDDLIKLVAKLQHEAMDDAEERAQTILLTAMERMSSEVTAERTVTAVKLTDDEMKGRIIGREGRNIRTLEQLTGVELIVDDTPEAVVLSGFDPVRREIAKVALEKLINDGRIHPARIEEMVEKAQREVDTRMREAGEAAVLEVGVHGIHPELVKLIGRMRYRTSYGQNALRHSIEVAELSGILAAEVGVDVRMAKRAGLLHDIGKAVDHEIEGSHVQLGVELCRKYKENQIVINTVESHHGDVEPESLIACIVQAADTISAARPGARRETIETYTNRLAQLEEITNSFEGVEKSFAVQAGREVRIMVVPEKVTDDDMVILAHNVAKRIEQEMQYPGQIRVNVIRESRVQDVAK